MLRGALARQSFGPRVSITSDDHRSVSGLVRGVDGIAHLTALEAGGRTLAVMGSGSDVIYPPEHTPLAHEIVGSGAVIIEYSLGVKPDPRHFHRRNRLLSGLRMGTLVVEASEGSRTQSTVRSALEQSRDVFGGPGSIYSAASVLTNR
jgi:DNA processing protein